MRIALVIAFLIAGSAAQAAVTGTLPQATDSSWDICRDSSKIDAITACTDLINVTPALPPAELAEAYFNRGSTYFRSGNPMTALADFDKSLALDPSNISAHVLRGAARAQTGDLDAAIVDFNAALAAKPDDPLVLVDRARTFAAKGDLNRATADASEAIKIDPMFAFAIAIRGALYEVQGNVQSALADFNAALAIDPSLAIAQQGRARLAK